jgi:beta-glucanase (GH16 family)
MAEIVNERDLILQAASIRVIVTGSVTPPSGAKSLSLSASSQVFNVSGTTATPSSVLLTANRSNVTAPVTFSVISGTATLSQSGDSATLSYANMSSDSVTIRAQAIESSGGSGGATPSNIRPVGQESVPYTLTFGDDFNGSTLDPSKWNTHGYNETEPAVQNYSVAGGCLNIWPDTGYVRRTIDADGKFSQKYGFFEIRAKLPRGKGVLPTCWFYTHTDTNHPQMDLMKAFPSGTTQTTSASSGNTTGPIGIEVYGDQMTFEDGANSGTEVGTTQIETFASLIDAAYVVTNKSDMWMELYKWRNNSPGWATLMANSNAKVIIIQSGWADYYAHYTTTQITDNLSYMIDTARTARIPKTVLIQLPNETDDSAWQSILTTLRNVATSKNVPVIDVFTYTKNYRTSSGSSIFSLCPNGYAGNQAHHTRIGQYIATRFKEIAAADLNFPTPATGGGTTAGGGNWGTIDYRPTDYAGRAFDNSVNLIGQRRLTDTMAAVDLSAGFHYYGVKWEPDGVTFYFDGVQMSTKIPTTALQTYPLYPILSLWYETTSGLTPDTTNTPQGSSNSFQIDYIRIWQLDTGTGAVPSGDASDVRPSAFPNATWPLIFRDEFDGSFNTSVWNNEIWYGDSMGNGGEQHTQTNYDVNAGGNSCLRIWPYQNPSGRFMQRAITTAGKFNFRYGYIEAYMKLPRGKGCWPAFWTFNTNGNENDIMEAYCGGTDGVWSSGSPYWKPTAFAATLHRNPNESDYQVKPWRPNAPFDDNFHKIGCLWEPDGMTFFLDGAALDGKFYTSSFAVQHFILFDLWFGSASGTPNTSETPTGSGNSFMIDWVRVWSLDGSITPQTTAPEPVQTTPGPSGATESAGSISVFYDDITIIKAKDGGLQAYLTNEMHTVSADSSGNVDSFTGAGSQMIVYLERGDDTSNWTFTRANGPGMTSTLSGNTLQITGMTADTGYVDVTAQRKSAVTTSTTVTAPSSTSQFHLGIHAHRLYNGSVGEVQAEGGTSPEPTFSYGLIRDWDISGLHDAAIWLSDGSINESLVEGVYAGHARHGAKVLKCFGSVPTWAAKRPSESNPRYPSYRGSLSGPANQAVYKDYCKRFITRFRSYLWAVEGWNEPYPNSASSSDSEWPQFTTMSLTELADTQKSLYQAAKEVDANLLVFSPCQAYVGGIDDLLSARTSANEPISNFFDVLSWHPYNRSAKGDAGPSLANEVSQVRSIMAAAGISKPLADTEHGWLDAPKEGGAAWDSLTDDGRGHVLYDTAKVAKDLGLLCICYYGYDDDLAGQPDVVPIIANWYAQIYAGLDTKWATSGQTTGQLPSPIVKRMNLAKSRRS